MTKLYKYLSPNLFPIIIEQEGFLQLRCCHPKEFNDPYELFLSIETNGVRAELLAFYQETVGHIPQFPTICFSKRPDVVPMWAHYAMESSGLVIEVDESALKEHYQEVFISDVEYSETATVIDIGYVARAFGTGKPRHTYWLQQAALHAAYFTKSLYWSYEFERRLIAYDHVRSKNNIMVLNIPITCITAIITGVKATKEFKQDVKQFCKKSKTTHYELKQSRTSIKPYLTKGRHSYEFDGENILKVQNVCTCCKEPITTDASQQCSWCAITDAHRYEAARMNPFRMLARYGLLEDYLRSCDDIAKGK